MAEIASAIVGAAGSFPGGFIVEEDDHLPMAAVYNNNYNINVDAPEVSRKTIRSRKQRHEDSLRERIYQQQARMARSCICEFGAICQTISAHFAVLKDPRGKFVVLPSSQSPLRDVYCQYLCPDNDDSMASSEDDNSDRGDEDEDSVGGGNNGQENGNNNEDEDDDGEDLDHDGNVDEIEGYFVAVHHFYPKVVENFLVKGHSARSSKVSRPDEDLLPIPTVAMTVDQRRACGIRHSNDRRDLVTSHQILASNNIYWIAPSYPFDKTQVDLEKATRRHLRKRKSRHRRRSKSRTSRRSSQTRDNKQMPPPVDEVHGPNKPSNDDDDCGLSDATETSIDSQMTWDDNDSLMSSSRQEPFLPLVGTGVVQDSPLVPPEAPDASKASSFKIMLASDNKSKDLLLSTKQDDPIPETLEVEKSDSETAANSSSDDDEKSEESNGEKADDALSTPDNTENENADPALENDKAGVQREPTSPPPLLKKAVSNWWSVFRVLIVGLCCLALGLVAVELSHGGIISGSKQEIPEALQSFTDKLKPVEESVASALRQAQAGALHVATSEAPRQLQRLDHWSKPAQNALYEAALRSMRSMRSYIVVVVTVQLPRFLQHHEMETRETRAQFQSRSLFFVTNDCPRYLHGLGAWIKTAGKQAIQAMWAEPPSEFSVGNVVVKVSQQTDIAFASQPDTAEEIALDSEHPPKEAGSNNSKFQAEEVEARN